MKPKLSICCLAYNHAKFIRQALDGFVMQKTNFPFEVLIHDDASTDGTADIIREYEAKYPNLIKPIYQMENQFSKGVCISKTINYPRVQGEYVAFCEGDDYWTDPLKLQKQVDFLDAHPDYMGCFHPAKMIWEDIPKKPSIAPPPYLRSFKKDFDIKDVLRTYFIYTPSVVYRWVYNDKELLENYPTGIIAGDLYLQIIHAKYGKIHMLDDVMSVYRRHKGGVWNAENTIGAHLKYGIKMIRLYSIADKLLDYKYSKQLNLHIYRVLFAIYRESVMYNDYEMFNRLKMQMPWPFTSRLFQSAMKLFLSKSEGFKELVFNRLCAHSGLGKRIKWSKEEIGDI